MLFWQILIDGTAVGSIDQKETAELPIQPGLTGIGADPPVAIGQRSLLIRTGEGNLLWDPSGFIDAAAVEAVRSAGGLRFVTASHPHFYGSMMEFAHAFDAPVYIHSKDRRWVARPDDSVVFWDGDTREIGDGLTLINAGVHFDGGQVLHWAADPEGKGALFSGDIFTVVPDRSWVSFMYSYPNLIPERPRTIRRALSLMQPFRFDRIYGAWWRRNVAADGVAAISRSAERYLSFALDDS